MKFNKAEKEFIRSLIETSVNEITVLRTCIEILSRKLQEIPGGKECHKFHYENDSYYCCLVDFVAESLRD